MEFKKEDFINSINISDMLEELKEGEYLYFGEWELFMSYTGTFWIRRELTQEEIDFNGFEEPGWCQEPCKTLEEALEKMGCIVQKQVSIFDVVDNP